MQDVVSNHLRQHAKIWRILVGLIIFTIVYVTPLVILGGMIAIFSASPSTDFTLGTTPIDLAMIMATFIPAWFGIRFAMFWPFRTTLQSLYGVANRLNWRDLSIGFSFAFCILCVLEIITALFLTGPGTGYEAQLVSTPDVWLMWFAPLFALILVQVGAEELLFRGYLLRTIWARGGRFWWAIFIPSFVFGLGHFSPNEFGPNAWLYAANTTVTGIILCAVTIWRGNMGAAFGLHLGVNCFSILILSNKGYLSGGALFLNQAAPDAPITGIAFAAATLIEIGLYVVWAHRTYGKIIPRP
jgi:membrane protease YdiL (CAAX protease family)